MHTTLAERAAFAALEAAVYGSANILGWRRTVGILKRLIGDLHEHGGYPRPGPVDLIADANTIRDHRPNPPPALTCSDTGT